MLSHFTTHCQVGSRKMSTEPKHPRRTFTRAVTTLRTLSSTAKNDSEADAANPPRLHDVGVCSAQGVAAKDRNKVGAGFRHCAIYVGRFCMALAIASAVGGINTY